MINLWTIKDLVKTNCAAFVRTATAFFMITIAFCRTTIFFIKLPLYRILTMCYCCLCKCCKWCINGIRNCCVSCYHWICSKCCKCVCGYKELPEEPLRFLLQNESNATNQFLEVFQKKIKSTSVTVDEFNSFNDENFPRTLIICDMKSRPDSDIASAVDSLDSRFFPQCILICLYIRDQHDLPTVSTASGSSALEYNFEDIIDIVFHPDRGIYNCNWNRVAMNKLENKGIQWKQ